MARMSVGGAVLRVRVRVRVSVRLSLRLRIRVRVRVRVCSTEIPSRARALRRGTHVEKIYSKLFLILYLLT